MAQKPKPWIEIVENIASTSYRFRYESENRPHGNIFGFNSTPKKPTYPKIRIHGIEAKGHIIVCCVSEKKPYMVHPHKVFSKAGGINSHGAYVVPIVKGQKEIEFEFLTIQCVKRKNMASSLEMRQKVRIDPYRSGFDHIMNPSSIDPFALRLCFQGFFIKPGTTKHSIITDPVVSQPIYDRNSTSDLTISKLNMAWAPVTGGSQLIFVCPNVSENDIKVRFFKMEEDKVVWECVCDAADVHEHVLVKVITPPYPDLKVINAVSVEIQLVRPSTGESGRPVPFSLLPRTWKTEEMVIGDPEVTIKRKRKRYLRIELSEIPKKAPCGCLLLPMINPICPIHNTQTDLDAPQTNRMKRPKVFFFNEKLGQERTAAYSVNGAASVPQVKLLKQKVQSAIRDLIAEKTTELQSASEPLNNQVYNNSPTPRNIPRKHNPTTAPPQNRKYKNLIPQPNPPKKQTYGEQISVIGVPNYQAYNNGAAGKQNMSTGQAYPQIPSAPALPINSPVCHTNSPVIHQDYQYGYNNIDNQARVMNNQPQQQQQYQYDYSGSSQHMQNNQGLLNNYNFQNNQVIQNHQNVQNHQNILINYQNLDNPNVQHDRGVQGKHNMPNGYNIPINQNIPSYQNNHNSLNNHNMHNTYTITNGHTPPNNHMNLNNYNPQNNQNYQNQNTQTNPNVVIHHNMPSNLNVLNNHNVHSYQNLQNNHSFQNNLVPYQQQYNHADNYDYGSRPHIKPIILYPDSSPPSCNIEYTPPVNWPYPIPIPGQYQDMYAIQANSPQNIAACAQSPMTDSVNHLNNDQGQQMVQAPQQCMNIPALEAAPADHDKIMDVTFAPDFDWEKYIQSLSDSLSDIKIL